MDIKKRAKETLEKIMKSKFFKLSSKINNKTKGQEFILNYLHNKNKEVSAGELSVALGVSTARIAVLLKKLIKNNYVIKTTSKADARVVMISITQTGIEYIEKENKGILDYIGRIIEKVGVEKIEEFIKTADELLVAIEPMSSGKEILKGN